MLLYIVLNILLFIIGLVCAFLVLANQNAESISDSSPINTVQSSQRDSIAINVIQIVIITFLGLVIVQNRVTQHRVENIEDIIFNTNSKDAIDSESKNFSKDHTTGDEV